MICAFGKISENLAQGNSLDICVLRPLSKCSMSSIFSIRKFCCVQVSLSVIQFKMWQKYIEKNRTVVNRFINYVQKYNSEHQLPVFLYKLKKTNLLLYSSYLKKKKKQMRKHLHFKFSYKNEEQMTKKKCPIQKHAWFIRTLLIIRLKTAGKGNNVQIYWRPWELAEISHKNLQNLIKAAFVKSRFTCQMRAFRTPEIRRHEE